MIAIPVGMWAFAAVVSALLVLTPVEKQSLMSLFGIFFSGAAVGFVATMFYELLSTHL